MVEPLGRILPLGDMVLRSGETLAGATLSYACWGTLNAARDNVVLLPTYYTGTHRSYLPWIGSGRALDPERWFIVSPNAFGNALSTSPSHAATPEERAAFPAIDVQDNVTAQYHLLFDELGISRIALAMGWSMGAMQSLHWAARFPDKVDALLPICGASSCWPLNTVFLAGVRAALTTDPVWAGGLYTEPPQAGLRAFGRVYAGWAYSAAFFRDALYHDIGCSSIDDFLLAWEDEHLAWDAADLLAMARTWEMADIGVLADGDREAALGRITARTIYMASDTDAYFTLAEARQEAAAIPGAQLRVLESPYGHCGGAPGRFPRETARIEAAARELLGT